MTTPASAVETLLARAAKLGATAGHNAATWATDGNTSDATCRRILAGIEDGDPAVLDQFRLPDLSGEFADEMTPARLADQLGIDLDDADELVMWEEMESDICQAWEEAVADAFWTELERMCRFQTSDEVQS